MPAPAGADEGPPDAVPPEPEPDPEPPGVVPASPGSASTAAVVTTAADTSASRPDASTRCRPVTVRDAPAVTSSASTADPPSGSANRVPGAMSPAVSEAPAMVPPSLETCAALPSTRTRRPEIRTARRLPG
ncbi:hypothetical protein BFL35_04755 [Clavibacter michiganensis]|nr:hypothetical protein BFL35_04755 [Clavibacter michiganensis]